MRSLLGEDAVMVDGVPGASDCPREFLIFDGCFDVDAVVDSSFNLGAFLVVVPGGNDQCR